MHNPDKKPQNHCTDMVCVVPTFSGLDCNAAEACSAARSKLCVNCVWWCVCLSCSAKLQELHAKIDELQTDNEHMKSQITASSQCDGEKQKAVMAQ